MMSAPMDFTEDEIHQAASRQRLIPKFDQKIEILYNENMLDEQHKIIAISYIIGLFLSNMFIISDYFVTKDTFYIHLIAHFIIYTPICSYIIRNIWNKSKLYHIYICLFPIVLSITLSFLLCIGRGNYRSNYLFGDILLMICCAVIGRSPIVYTIGTVSLQYFFYIIVLVNTDIVPPDNIVLGALFGLTGAVVAIMTSYTLEQSSRRAFLLNLRIRLLNQDLKAMTMTDPLTGLGNRRSFEEAAERVWARSAVAPQAVSFILIDIDRFKVFNDNYGHGAGDLCLTTIAKCLAASIRRNRDTAVRWGGEEFLVFLSDTDFGEARLIANAIRLAILDAAIPHPAIGADAVVSASLGIATTLTNELKPAELIIRADMALYAAKNNGRNQVWPPVGFTDMNTSRAIRSDGLIVPDDPWIASATISARETVDR